MECWWLERCLVYFFVAPPLFCFIFPFLVRYVKLLLYSLVIIIPCRIAQVQSNSVVSINGLLSSNPSTDFRLDLSQGSDLATQRHSPSYP